MNNSLNLHDLPPVSETLLFPLYLRAMEARRPDGLLRDDLAARLVEGLDYDFSRFSADALDQVTAILRVRQFDRICQAFLAAHPEQAAVVQLGCGLDTRFERVDNGRVEWYDLDVPEVVALRRALIDPGERAHLLSGSAFEPGWMEELARWAGRPLLVLAEGVFMYFTEADICSLVLGLHERFPGTELAFDIATPLMNSIHNPQLRRSGLAARLQWGITNNRELEGWASGIRLLSAWYYFDQPEPRLNRYRWLRFLPLVGRASRILHYKV